MSFRDFISNWRYRRRVEREFARFQNITPPENPSRRYIDKLVRRLLDERKSPHAFKELEMIGVAAAPSLRAALGDERFRVAVREGKSWCFKPPVDACLELLVPHDADTVLSVAAPLAESGSKDERQTAALHLASLGDARTLPILSVLLQDKDGYVRSYATMGCNRACTSGRATQEFRAAAYDLLLQQCDQKWSGTLNEAPTTVIELDRDLAAIDFAMPRFLTASNPCVSAILEACNEANIVLPASLVHDILDQSLPHVVGEDCYPYDRVAAACCFTGAIDGRGCATDARASFGS